MMIKEKINMKNFGGPVLFLDRSDINTDEIIPAKYLTEITKEDLKPYMLEDLKLPGFDSKSTKTRAARVVLSRANFGCGSSREHAVYALWDYGFRAVIAPSYGDIFYGNSLKNGFLPIVLPADAVADLRGQVQQHPGARVVVDLEQQQVVGPDGRPYRFEIDAFRKQCLLKGTDELDFTLSHRAEIEAHERAQGGSMPWL